jgi:hypothetical protein
VNALANLALVKLAIVKIAQAKLTLAKITIFKCAPTKITLVKLMHEWSSPRKLKYFSGESAVSKSLACDMQIRTKEINFQHLASFNTFE